MAFKKADQSDAVIEVPWWDRDLVHPMDDAQFIQAFCEYVFATTTDHSIRIVRNRAYRFIRNFMHPQLEVELTKHQEAHRAS